LSLFLMVASPAIASDYAQFRGPHRDGHSSETGLLREWPKEGPRLVWQVKDIGSGYSTPSVAGDTLYLLGNEGLDNEFALALSARDGKRLWSAKLGKVGHPDQNPRYPAARSTPTVEGDSVYALGSEGDLVCLARASGKEIWRKNLREDFGGKFGEWAYAESPLVDHGLVLCTPGGSNATIVALHAKTGEVAWTCALPEGDEASYSSMIAARLGGVDQYVQFFAKGLAGIDAAHGKLLWRYERTAKGSPAVMVTPVADDGLIYSGAYRAGGAVVRPVQKAGAWEVEEIRFDTKLPAGVGGVVKVGDFLYGSTADIASCVEFKTGIIRWQERAPASSWLYADGRCYLHSENGEVALIEPSPQTFHELARFTPPGRPTDELHSKAWAYPVIAGGKLYLRELNCLWCYDIKQP